MTLDLLGLILRAATPEELTEINRRTLQEAMARKTTYFGPGVPELLSADTRGDHLCPYCRHPLNSATCQQAHA